MLSRTRLFSVLGVAILAALIFGGWLLSAPALPDFSVVRARWHPSDAQLLDRNGEVIQEIRIDRHGRRLAWTPLRDISPALQQEVIASEDHRFASHHGIDVVAVAAGLVKNLIGKPLRGASTITMQVAAMLDPRLRRHGRHRGFGEKLAQMRAAVALERRWSKDEILECYFNLVTWRGELEGIGAASRVMFGKAPHGIDRAEAIVLASLLRAPNANRGAVERRALALRSATADAPDERAVVAAVATAFAHNPSRFARLALAPQLAQRLMPEGSAQARCTLDRDLQRIANSALLHQIGWKLLAIATSTMAPRWWPTMLPERCGRMSAAPANFPPLPMSTRFARCASPDLRSSRFSMRLRSSANYSRQPRISMIRRWNFPSSAVSIVRLTSIVASVAWSRCAPRWRPR